MQRVKSVFCYSLLIMLGFTPYILMKILLVCITICICFQPEIAVGFNSTQLWRTLQGIF